jgi:prephenate dehydratase
MAVGTAAYQGVPGAFSEEAARQLLGEDAELRPCATLTEVFAALEIGRVDAVVVPVENSLAGAVPGCADLIARHPVHIVAERLQPIAHALMAPPGVPLSAVRRVRSHPVALAQCAAFFREHPNLQPVAAFDTAGAVADLMSSGSRDEAAIASRRAAALYGAAVLAEDIQDRADNVTRFLHIESGPASTVPSVGHKTSVICVLRHEPGSLHAALGVFASRGLNLTRIESYPISDRPFEYGFVLDIGPTPMPWFLADALGDLERRSRHFRVLGHYAESTPA